MLKSPRQLFAIIKVNHINQVFRNLVDHKIGNRNMKWTLKKGKTAIKNINLQSLRARINSHW